VYCTGLRSARLIRAAVAVSISSFLMSFAPAFEREHQTRQESESKMPKMKTKSGAKKRFKLTATGKVKYAQSGKRHGMIKRSNKQIRDLRGTAVMFDTDGYNVKRYFMPNG
jgi:large subunit ribosomal protein L35